MLQWHRRCDPWWPRGARAHSSGFRDQPSQIRRSHVSAYFDIFLTCAIFNSSWDLLNKCHLNVSKCVLCCVCFHSRMDVPLSIDDISQFGDGSRELFIKSSCYSMITVAMGDCGPTISWMFSSEPKSISFSVVYRESMGTQVEQAKVDALSVSVFMFIQKDPLPTLFNLTGLFGVNSMDACEEALTSLASSTSPAREGDQGCEYQS